jgi:hypothetical protein
MECPRWCSRCDWQGYDECPCKLSDEERYSQLGEQYIKIILEDNNEQHE